MHPKTMSTRDKFISVFLSVLVAFPVTKVVTAYLGISRPLSSLEITVISILSILVIITVMLHAKEMIFTKAKKPRYRWINIASYIVVVLAVAEVVYMAVN